MTAPAMPKAKSAGWKLGAILEKAAVKPSPRCSSFALASAPGESRTAAPTLSKSQTKSRYGRFRISSFLISGLTRKLERMRTWRNFSRKDEITGRKRAVASIDSPSIYLPFSLSSAISTLRPSIATLIAGSVS